MEEDMMREPQPPNGADRHAPQAPPISSSEPDDPAVSDDTASESATDSPAREDEAEADDPHLSDDTASESATDSPAREDEAEADDPHLSDDTASESATDSPAREDEAEADDPHLSDDTANESATDSPAREDEDEAEAEPEAEPDGPEDWESFAHLSGDEVFRQLKTHRVIEDSLNREAWLRRMRQLPLVRALYSKMRGKRFEKAVKDAVGIGHTAAYGIATHIYSKPGNVQELWDEVIAEAHQAQIKGDAYKYPSLKKMIAKYTPPKDGGKEDTEDTEDTDASGDNDPRTKAAIIQSEMSYKDQAQLAARAYAKLKEQFDSRTRDFDTASAQASERLQKLTHAQEIMARYRRNEEALAAKNEKLLAEVTRLQALVTPVNDNGDDEPDDPNGSAAPAEPHEPNPDPPDPVATADEPADEPQQRKRTLGDVLNIRTDIDPKWGAEPHPGGGKMKDYAEVAAKRIAAYTLLHDEPDVIGQAASETLNTLKISFFRQTTLDMDLDRVLMMVPDKP